MVCIICPRAVHGTGSRHRSLGAYFPDLPSNMLGSFLMGLLAASGTLGIPNSKELAILPESSSWQVASESCFPALPAFSLMMPARFWPKALRSSKDRDAPCRGNAPVSLQVCCAGCT